MKTLLLSLTLLFALPALGHQDTIPPPSHKEVLNRLFYSEDFYYNAYQIHMMRIDSLTKIVDVLLGSKGLVLRTEKDIAELIRNYNALTEADKQELLRLQKEIRKHRRRKNFWKVTTVLMTGTALYIAITK
jgi:hypothetical protein